MLNLLLHILITPMVMSFINFQMENKSSVLVERSNDHPLHSIHFDTSFPGEIEMNVSLSIGFPPLQQINGFILTFWLRV